MPPLQAVGGRGGGARLLDDDRGGADRGPLRRPAGSVGAVSRGGGLSRRPENLCVGHVHHVFFARHVLLLCTAAASFLEVCMFLGRAVKAPQVRRAEPRSKTKIANILKITHRD